LADIFREGFAGVEEGIELNDINENYMK